MYQVATVYSTNIPDMYDTSNLLWRLLPVPGTIPYQAPRPRYLITYSTLQAVTDFAGEFFKLEELPAPHTEVVQN